MKIKLFTLIFALTISSFAANKQQFDASLQEGFNPPWAFMRGIVNVATCWLEIPRCMVDMSALYPPVGFFSGVVKGAFLCSCRAVLSVYDLAFLGFTGPNAYRPDFFEEFVWNSPWNSYRIEGRPTPNAEVEPMNLSNESPAELY